MPEVAAKLVGWPAAPLRIAQIKPLLAAGGPLKLGVAEPRRETASLAATMLLGDALATSDEDLPALVKTFRSVVKTSSTGELLRTFGERVNAGPASEQSILTYNEDEPSAQAGCGAGRPVRAAAGLPVRDPRWRVARGRPRRPSCSGRPCSPSRPRGGWPERLPDPGRYRRARFPVVHRDDLRTVRG